MARVRKGPTPFALGTLVPIERSRDELEALLDRHGASQIAVFRKQDETVIIFSMQGRMVKQTITQPTPASLPKTGRTRSPLEVKNAIDAEWRRRWRARVLIVKGKLEMVMSGESTFEVEFLAETMLSNGQTVAEAMLPRIAESYAIGGMPNMALPSGD